MFLPSLPVPLSVDEQILGAYRALLMPRQQAENR
jgi:hypothetical protein